MRIPAIATCGLVLSTLVLAPLAAQDGERQVFVTVLASDGAAVEGLTAEHFAVREAGKDRQVLRVEPLRIPMHVAVLVDTSANNGALDVTFQNAVTEFVGRLAPSNHVALYAFGDRASQVVPFSQDPARLRAAAVKMFGWSQQRSHLIDAIDLAIRDLGTIETARPVIVAITSESPEASRQGAGGVIKRLIAQSIAFHAVSLASATGSGAAGVSNNIPTSSQRLGALMASGEGDRERNRVLEQGTAATGGGRQRLTTMMALAPALARLSNELANSYRLTFTRPGSDRVRDLQVGIMVDGVTLRATPAPYGTR